MEDIKEILTSALSDVMDKKNQSFAELKQIWSNQNNEPIKFQDGAEPANGNGNIDPTTSLATTSLGGDDKFSPTIRVKNSRYKRMPALDTNLSQSAIK